MTKEAISIVGIGLRYPDSCSPEDLWENVLAGRRAFRRLPDCRINHADYYSADPAAPDRFYTDTAAVLRDFTFDRHHYRVAGSTFRSTDMTHWLALDVTAKALADAGFPDGDGLPRRSTGVLLGNSLTGEFARANLMRLRWPYVRRTVAATFAEQGWADADIVTFLRELEVRYKAPFPPVDEDTLAGGLSNTIAGRICNHFDLAGGGYTVDGACSSSLLAVITAANALTRGDLDVGLAGGVDLSIDPFEVIGFAKTGALATDEMRVYDRGSNGFWPGEGAGVLVLMRESDAIAGGHRIYASITGWGVSSDGKGGLTRPEADGHRIALQRAYRRAGYGVESVSYFEGHGTGTAVGDATEIEALSGERRGADPAARPAALGTVKGNIGHTKAAAGVAGLIKTAMAVHNQIIPPVTGNREPHPLLTGEDAMLYLPREASLWPAGQEIRAGVSAMGFGGINTHVAMRAAPAAPRRTAVDDRTRELVDSRQDAELLLFDGTDPAALRDRVGRVAALVATVSEAELGDLARTCVATLTGARLRAAVVATGPRDAAALLATLLELLDSGARTHVRSTERVFLGTAAAHPRIGYLFPGQGSGRGSDGALTRRFGVAAEIVRTAEVPVGDHVDTEVAQPRIVAGSRAGLAVLDALGVAAVAAAGHSLGELTALHWAGSIDGPDLQHLAAARGRVMATGDAHGAMAVLTGDAVRAGALIGTEDLVIAGYNASSQTVVSGHADAVDRVCAAARQQGVAATRLAVSHAFHSPAMRSAAARFGEHLTGARLRPPRRPVVSTVTGGELPATKDLPGLLREQMVAPVRFLDAAIDLAGRADLVIEVGPGRVLADLFGLIAPDVPALSVETDSRSLVPLLRAAGAAHTIGAQLDTEALFAGRVLRDLPLDAEPSFLASPCEAAQSIDEAMIAPAPPTGGTTTPATAPDPGVSTLDLLRRVTAERVELPLDSVGPDTHPLDELHMSSITVGQVMNEVARALDRPPFEAMPSFATVNLGELATMIDDLDGTNLPGDAAGRGEVVGIAPWVRSFAVEHVDTPPRPVPAGTGGTATWTVFAPDGHPLSEPLRTALAGAGIGDGVLLCLPATGTESLLGLMLEAGRAALAAPGGTRFVVVQHGYGASGLARSAHLENPAMPTTVVTLADPADDRPADHAAQVRWVVAEAAATNGFGEARFDGDGTRSAPALRLVAGAPPADAGPLPLGPDDVLLATGGGKGITAECALSLAATSGARLALLGRGDPVQDTELAANLARMRAAGVHPHYERADVTSAHEVAAAVERIRATLGPVTAILHGAGRNEPAALTALTEEAFRATIAPKIDGLRAVLDSVDEAQLRLLVTFGSIIGRAGLRGEAHYATANDWMSELTERYGRTHPHTRVLAMEWSVWSGAGMGERLGVVEALKRDGITPIPADAGIAALHHALATPGHPPVVVVSGRTGGLATLPLPRHDLPLARFLDRILVHYPGIELVTEADLTADSDPYLADHLLDRDMLFPAVLGMEAMAQVATAVMNTSAAPRLENAEFLRPIVVPPGGGITIRMVALVQDADTVTVAIRSGETSFGTDHFRARLRFPDGPSTDLEARSATGPIPTLPPVAVDPVTELYGGVLFQGKRFQCLTGYRQVSARRAVADVTPNSPDADWFAPFLPQHRLLADPGARDTMMHAIQCCVPDATLLPQSIERLYPACPDTTGSGPVVLDARERSQDGDSYVYDLDVLGSDGTVLERWEGLKLRAVRKLDGKGPWVPPLLGPYLERSCERVLGRPTTVVVEPDPRGTQVADTRTRRAQTELSASRAAGRPVAVRYRPDGRPETGGEPVSASHGSELTLVVTGTGVTACDVEAVVERSEQDWAGLLGPDLTALRDLLVGECGEAPAVAGTRAWSAMECVRKTGQIADTLVLEEIHPDGWVVLSAGPTRIGTWVTTVQDRLTPTVFAVLRNWEG